MSDHIQPSLSLLPRPASASASEQAHIVTVGNMNGANRLFGGLLFSWMDETAGVTARRHAGTHVTTATVESLRYLCPVVRNQVLMCEAKVIYTGKTSLEVLATAWLEDFDGTRTLAADGRFIFVALDENGNKVQVPPLLIETPEEQALFDAAVERRKK
ncbi:MAG: acyl-CoA thioesterase [Clostridia bacterium]|nr:acyl-CoA thioesterase [Clostridia bacterium]